MGEKELGRWLRVASTIISILLSIIAFGVTYSIRQLDDRIAKIEQWREKHEEKTEKQMIEISQSLARIETTLDIKKSQSTRR